MNIGTESEGTGEVGVSEVALNGTGVNIMSSPDQLQQHEQQGQKPSNDDALELDDAPQENHESGDGAMLACGDAGNNAKMAAEELNCKAVGDDETQASTEAASSSVATSMKTDMTMMLGAGASVVQGVQEDEEQPSLQSLNNYAQGNCHQSQDDQEEGDHDTVSKSNDIVDNATALGTKTTGEEEENTTVTTVQQDHQEDREEIVDTPSSEGFKTTGDDDNAPQENGKELLERNNLLSTAAVLQNNDDGGQRNDASGVATSDKMVVEAPQENDSKHPRGEKDALTITMKSDIEPNNRLMAGNKMKLRVSNGSIESDTADAASGCDFHPGTCETNVDSQQQQSATIVPGAVHIQQIAQGLDDASSSARNNGQTNNNDNDTTILEAHAQRSSHTSERSDGPPMLEATLVDDSVVVEAQPIHNDIEQQVSNDYGQSSEQSTAGKFIEQTGVKPTHKLAFFVIILVVGASLAVGLGLSYGTKSSDVNDDGSSAPIGEVDKAAREDAFKEVIVESMYSIAKPLHLPYASFINATSPQSLALAWLSSKDEIDPPLDPFDDAQEGRILQRYVMAVLYYSLGGDKSSLGEELGFLGPKHECQWKDETGAFGVKSCSSSDDDSTVDPNNPTGMVSSLDFAGINLMGTIPREVGCLTNLTAIRFLDNDLGGPIPTELGALPKLQFLTLQTGGIVGTIPPQLGNAPLNGLWLSGNKLTGAIPRELAECPLRWGLSLRENLLTGTVPRTFANLTELSYMEFQDNNLEGDIDFLCEALPDSKLSVSKDTVSCGCCECCS